MARRPRLPTAERTQRRRPGSWSGRRAAWLAGATLLILGGLPVGMARGSTGPTLVNATVYTPDSSIASVPVTFSELATQPGQPTYTGSLTIPQYDAAGEVTDPGALAPEDFPDGQGTWPISSVAMAAALTATGQVVPLSGISSVVVFSDGNSPESALSPADLAQPSDFSDPTESPVITDFGGYEYYYRPRRNDGDANATDAIGPNATLNSANEDNPINIEVFLANSLQVSISAPETTITAGATLTFGSSSNAPTGDPVQYAWSLQGQSQGTGPSQILRFPNAGTYTVNLEVTDPSTGDSGGAAVTVQVNSPTATTTTQSGTSTLPVGGSGSAGSGPSQSTGTTPGAQAGTPTTPGSSQARTTHPGTTATSGAADAVTTTATTPRASTGDSGTSPVSASAGGHSAVTTTAAADRGAPDGGAPDATVTGPAGSSPVQPHRRSATPAAPSRSTSARRLRLVRGVLVGDVVALPTAAAARSGRSPAEGHAPGLAPAGHVSSLAAAAAIAGALVLLGLGVGRELGGRRLRSRRTPPRNA